MLGTRTRTPKLVLCALGLALAWGGCNHIGDEICPADSFDPNMRSEDCPYGPPGGPKVRETGCADNKIDMTATGCDSLSWDDDIWPLLTSGQSDPTLNCAASFCHDPPMGQTPPASLRLPADDAEAAYTALSNFTLMPGYPYLSDKNPAHTWILCNLHGLMGGSAPMPPPKGLSSDTDYQTVATWVACGEQRTKTGGSGSGGGADAGP